MQSKRLRSKPKMVTMKNMIAAENLQSEAQMIDSN